MTALWRYALIYTFSAEIMVMTLRICSEASVLSREVGFIPVGIILSMPHT